MNIKTWAKGLLAAVIGGAASSGTVAVADPAHFNFSHDGLIGLAKVAAAGALIALLGYLKQSPIPDEPKPPLPPAA